MVTNVPDKYTRPYHALVSSSGILLWGVALAGFLLNYPVRDQVIVLALVPLVVVVGLFPNSFPLPSGLRIGQKEVSFTLSDAFVLVIASWFGLFPAVFVAGIEAFTSSRRCVRRLTSNLFSSGMMSLVAAAASASLSLVLRRGLLAVGPGRSQPFREIAVALLIGSIVQVIVNWGLLSTLLALRHGHPILRTWKENFLCAAPMFLPSSVAASLMCLTLQYDAIIMVVIGGPILLTIHFGHRQYHRGVQARIDVMEKAHRETIEALAVAINAKDEVTHEHVMRVQIYSAGVARLLGCSEAEIEALRAGALLHDIGKIAVPDYILNKPGKLTLAEFEKMKTHTIVGSQILGRVEFPYPVTPVVRHHHERWDGKGYPDGLSGETIPLTARILSVVDCFDAVREDRQYRKGMTRDQAIDFIMSNSGSMYDPRVVGTFVTHLPEFEAEILAHRNDPAPSFGIEPIEELSEAARLIEPAAGLAKDEDLSGNSEEEFSQKEMLALYDIVRVMNTQNGREEVLSAFLKKLRDVVPFDTCAIALIAQDTGEISVERAAGEHARLLEMRNIAPGEGVTGWVIANQQPFCNTDPRLDLTPDLAAYFAGYKTLAAYPITKGRQTFGAVTLYSSALREYDARQQKLAKESAGFLASALASLPSPSSMASIPVSHKTSTPKALESDLSH